MKNILLISLLLITSIVSAQTPYTMISSHPEGPARLSTTSLDNPWVGAKLAYNLAGDVSNSFLLSGRAMYMFDKGDKYAIPIIANVGISQIDSLDDDSGVSIGVYPWYTFYRQYNKVFNIHGAVNYHIAELNAEGSISDVRIMAGIEAAFYPKDNGMPATLSIGPEYVINTSGGINNTASLNITGVLPIATGLGVLFESDISLSSKLPGTGLKVGVILNNSLK